MPKTERELAFLRDLYINEDWTKRFTDLLDEHLDLKDVENLIYLNAGTGHHCLEIREKAGEKTAIFGQCNDPEMLSIARDKALATKSDVEFSIGPIESNAFDTVVADATFIRPDELEEFISETVRVAEPGGEVAVMIPAAGSFGEIFSLLWEVLFNLGLGEHGAAAEKMITELPSAGRIKEFGENAGLVNIRTVASNEVFEYENGEAFNSSPLLTEFLMPEWLKTLDENEKEQVSEKLAQLIDAEDGDLTFRFSVKATLLMGEKSYSH
ncbi:MAG: class I SAM-dependent methyltransferase [Pyrinomonadaceae bacterium]|nr:class I SAM-dependent methyltransferase [Pyrinomonadaceae bacterium]